MGMGFVLKSGWTTQNLELKKNWLTFTHQLSGTNISLLSVSSILLLPPCWDFCQSLFFSGCDKRCNLICTFVLLGLENSFLIFIHHSGCYNLSTDSSLVVPETYGNGCDVATFLGITVPSPCFPILCKLPICRYMC